MQEGRIPGRVILPGLWENPNAPARHASRQDPRESYIAGGVGSRENYFAGVVRKSQRPGKACKSARSPGELSCRGLRMVSQSEPPGKITLPGILPSCMPCRGVGNFSQPRQDNFPWDLTFLHALPGSRQDNSPGDLADLHALPGRWGFLVIPAR